jgi:mitochondrial intermembrane space import and assembly protein 40
LEPSTSMRRVHSLSNSLVRDINYFIPSHITDSAIDSVYQPSDSLSRESTPPTIESITAEKRKRQEAIERKSPASLPESSKIATTSSTETPENRDAATASTDPSALEEEAGQQGAFNPETGEINWDCPCLGGMAHGPCGEDFKAAFSCFVFSEEDPKGMDCIDKFKYVLGSLVETLN